MRNSFEPQSEFPSKGSRSDKSCHDSFLSEKLRIFPNLLLILLLVLVCPAAARTNIVELADNLTNPLHPLFSATCRDDSNVEKANDAGIAFLGPGVSTGPSPGMTALRSFCVPGWGQFTNGKLLKGFVFLVAEVALGTKIYFQTKRIDDHWNKHEYWAENATEESAGAKRDRYYQLYSNEFDRRRNSVWILSGVLIYSVLDAYVDAQLRSFESEGNPY